MAKRRSLKSYLMTAKSHSKKKTGEEESAEASQQQGKHQAQAQAQEVGRDNFGAQTNDERTTNESISNSIAGDSSSGYNSVAVAGTSSTSAANATGDQFYPIAARPQAQPAKQQPRPRHCSATERLAISANGMGQQQRLVMVNERLSGEKSRGDTQLMWPAMIDDDLGGGGGNNGNAEQRFGVCNKVHLIDDDDGHEEAIDVDVDVDIDMDSYDIDCVAAAAAGAGNEDNNNISERFHRHRYCVDSKSSLASRFDESFQLERQRHQQQFQTSGLHQASHRQQQQQQQYFHQSQAIPSYQHQAASFLHPSQFQPSHNHNYQQHHHQQQQQQHHSSLLNGVGSSPAAISQQQVVNYARQPADDLFGQQLHYPIAPPKNYSQQQYHTLIRYQQQQHHPYSGWKNSRESFVAGDTNQNEPSYSSSNNQPSLSPSGARAVATSNKMQPANSRQYLTTGADSHQHHQSSNHHKSSSRRQPSGGAQTRGAHRTTGSDKSRPALDCCGKLAKLMLFATNLLFWSAGIALGAWGILSLVEDHKYNLSQLLVFEPNSRMSLFQLLSWSFITLGCATILVGFCGCSAIFKNNRWILGLYIFLVLAIFALDLATGLLAIIFQEKLVASVRLRLANKLRADYGVQASFTAAVDYIQTKFECCGLEGHFDYDQSVWRLQRLGGFEATVARTCCHLRNTFDDQAHINPRPVNESMCQSTDVRFHQSYRYRKGCLDDLERLVRHKIWTFTLGCAAVGGVILISLMFATCFCRSIQSYNNSRKESPSSIGEAVSSPKHLDGNSNSNRRHFASGAGHQPSSQRHHHK